MTTQPTTHRTLYWQQEPTGWIAASVAGQVEMFPDLGSCARYLSYNYPDTDFEFVEVTENTWAALYEQGVFFDDWS